MEDSTPRVRGTQSPRPGRPQPIIGARSRPAASANPPHRRAAPTSRLARVDAAAAGPGSAFKETGAVEPHALAAHRAEGGDVELQVRLLQDVSRTFALTIPQLPEPLRLVVGNAYLLCRIADTIEDDPGLDTAAKTHFQNALLAALRTGHGAEALAASLGHALSEGVPLAERQLVIAAPRLLGLTRTFDASDLNAIGRCVEIMGRGMAHFDRVRGRHGITDLGELDRYCYTVAGVVGEMLTDLFCGHSEAIAARRGELDRRAIRFGRGLQLTNILKDIWQDLEHGRCWLPRDVFERHGYQLRRLAKGHDRASASAFTAGLDSLIAVAHSDLREALDYTLLIPSRETGIRKFLVWAIVLAALTLRKIHAQPLFSDGSQVKVSRRSVAATMVASRAVIRSNVGLTALFRVAARGLPVPRGDEGLRRSAVRPALSNG